MSSAGQSQGNVGTIVQLSTVSVLAVVSLKIEMTQCSSSCQLWTFILWVSGDELFIFYSIPYILLPTLFDIHLNKNIIRHKDQREIRVSFQTQ